ncbi:MAG TPA: hypothetical protein PKA88_00085 [Polyangiaceae bacterium]|nr:hypothetical protein [Polyangiaceae bacterium]
MAHPTHFSRDRRVGLPSAPWLAALCVAMFGCSKTEPASGESTEKDDTTQRELQKRDAYFSKLMGAGPKQTEGVEKPCPDEAISRALKGDPGRVVITEHAFLSRFAGTGADLYAGTGAKFKSLTAPAFRILLPSTRATSRQQSIDALWNIKKVEREYTHIGVLRAATRTGPTVTGEKFQTGKYAGVLLIFEMSKTEVLCAAEIQAENSESFATQAGRSADDAAWADYISQVRGAVHAGVRRISKRLELDLE